jgi:hypothetical protein
VLLAQGNYRLEVRVSASKLDPLIEDSGTGAGVRISGGKRDNKVVGDAAQQAVTHDFRVDEPTRIVELVAELRARAGSARFHSPFVLSVRP